MISFPTAFINTYSQELYNDDIKKISYASLKCSCGAVGHFHDHARYSRYLVIDSDTTIILSVQRIMCESCHRTHALLPDIIIPFRVFSNPLVKKIISSFYDQKNIVSAVSRIFHLSYEAVSSLISFFTKNHLHRLEVLSAQYDIDILNHSFHYLFWNENRIIFMQRIKSPPVLFFSIT